MNKLQEKWLHDLETTKVPQIQQILTDGGGFCCLGRLEVCAGTSVEALELTGKTALHAETARACNLRSVTGEIVLKNLSDEEEKWLTQTGCSTLAALNDSLKMSFKEIAAFIRRNEAAVFKS